MPKLKSRMFIVAQAPVLVLSACVAPQTPEPGPVAPTPTRATSTERTAVQPVLLPGSPRAMPVEVAPLGSPSLPPSEDIAPLMECVGGASIIGLGEATHGTREFTTARAALVLELARKNRLAAVALEVSYADCVALNEYVVFGTGDATSAVANMGVWPWRTEEVRDLAQALRDHNRAIHDVSKRVRFLGFDTQSVGSACRLFRERLARSDGAAAVVPAVDRLAEFSRRADAFTSWGSAQTADAEQVAAFLETASDPSVTGLDLRLLAMNFKGAARIWSKPDIYRQVAARDEACAEMLLAIHSHAGGPVAAWAHNGHVMRFSQEIQPGVSYRTLGAILHSSLKSRYVPVAFFFDRGSFLAFSPELGRLATHTVGTAKPDSLTHALREAGAPNGVIDLRRDPNAAAFLSREWSVRQVEAVFDPSREPDAYASDRWSNLFDVIVYFESTRELTPIPRAAP